MSLSSQVLSVKVTDLCPNKSETERSSPQLCNINDYINMYFSPFKTKHRLWLPNIGYSATMIAVD